MLYIHHVINDYALSHLPLGWDAHIIFKMGLVFTLFNVASEALAVVCKAFYNGRAVLKMICG